MYLLQKIENSNHIAIKVCKDSFFLSSAVYTFLMVKHKKATLVYSEKLPSNFSFVPWYDSVRESMPTSADTVLRFDDTDVFEMYHLFKTELGKINQKMAIALYADLMLKYDFCRSKECNGTFFALVGELLEAGATHKICCENLLYRESLALVRLTSIMFKNMFLSNNATVANIEVYEDNFKLTGASLDNAYSIAPEMLKIVNVIQVVLKKDNKVLKVFKEV